MASATKDLRATKRRSKISSSLVAKSTSNHTFKTFTDAMKSTTKEPASSVAAPKVFGIPEVLEAILMQLPPGDLLRLQRVNSTFKATIERSAGIQKILFLKSRSVEKIDNPTINPFIALVLHRYGIPSVIHRVTPNRIMRFPVESLAAMPESGRIGATDRIVVEIKAYDHKLPLLLTPFRESYKDMQLADSPVEISVHDPYIHGFVYNETKSTTTMRGLIDVLQRREPRNK